MEENQNPKLKGTDIIEAIPQTGECPVGCDECFYNGGRFYRPLDKPLLPTIQEARNKIVRVNPGHDSNIQKGLVNMITVRYPHKFYNTSIPDFDFPGPVVFTCNGRNLHLVFTVRNLMAVRVRVSTWNLEEVDKAAEHYLKLKVPVLLTFMRYSSIHDGCRPIVLKKEDYEWRSNILNEYWCIKPETMLRVTERYKGTGVRMCGTPASSLCIDCRNCEFLYWQHLREVAK